MSTLQKTTNYSQFKFYPENRQVNKIEFLLNAISQRNMLEFHPIHVDKNFKVVDGQHRLMCAQELQVPIYFIVDPNASLEDIAPLNSCVRSWNSQDFTNFYAKQGNENYIFVKKMVEKFKFDYYFVICACFDSTKVPDSSLKSTITRKYKEGKLKISKNKMLLETEISRVKEIIDAAKEYLGWKKSNVVFLRCALALIRHPNYNHNLLMKKLAKNPTALRSCLLSNSTSDINDKLYDGLYNLYLNYDNKARISPIH